jgi:hypothetical protein
MKSLGLGERVQILNPDENSNSYIKVTNDGKTVVNHKDDGSIILGDEAGSYIKLDGMN